MRCCGQHLPVTSGLELRRGVTKVPVRDIREVLRRLTGRVGPLAERPVPSCRSVGSRPGTGVSQRASRSIMLTPAARAVHPDERQGWQRRWAWRERLSGRSTDHVRGEELKSAPYPWMERTPRIQLAARPPHLPFVDQCHASLGRFEKPKRAALAVSQPNAGEVVVIVDPFSVKSMASPISCIEVPGMAVGTRQELAGAL